MNNTTYSIVLTKSVGMHVSFSEEIRELTLEEVLAKLPSLIFKYQKHQVKEMMDEAIPF